MGNSVWITIIFSLATPGVSGAKVSSVKAYKKHLALRKADFEVYLQTRDRPRRGEPQAIRRIQEARKARQAKALRDRRQFHRGETVFPKKAYREFVVRREKKRRAHAKAAQEYRRFIKKVRKVEKTPRYRVDMKKAYRLD